MRVQNSNNCTIALLMLAFLASCDQDTQKNNGLNSHNLATSTEVSDGALANSASLVFAGEVDPSDERINSPGAGRDLTLTVKDDPAVMDALVGSWAGSTESCNSGEAIGFFSDGSYGLEGEGGQWVLAGDMLRFDAVKVFEMGVEGVTSATRDPVKLIAIDATSMRWRNNDGSQSKFVRCYSNR